MRKMKNEGKRKEVRRLGAQAGVGGEKSKMSHGKETHRDRQDSQEFYLRVKH